jgi:hypothetical protein
MSTNARAVSVRNIRAKKRSNHAAFGYIRISWGLDVELEKVEDPSYTRRH